MRFAAFLLQRPPASTPTTTRWQRSSTRNSAYFLSLSTRARVNTAPYSDAAFGHGLPQTVTALPREGGVNSKLGAMVHVQTGNQYCDCTFIRRKDVWRCTSLWLLFLGPRVLEISRSALFSNGVSLNWGTLLCASLCNRVTLRIRTWLL